MSCWICIQKAAWRKQKKNAARQKAKDLAKRISGPAVIVREGGIYTVMEVAASGGLNVVETISELQ